MADGAAAAEGRLRLTILVGFGGASESLDVPASATVADLRAALEPKVEMSGLAYRLILDGVVLEPPTAKLSDRGVVDGASIMLVKVRAWDYTKIKSFEKVQKCERYPNGVLIDAAGKLMICHFWGELTVWGPNYEPLPGREGGDGQAPSQMAWGRPGEFLVAYRALGGVKVFDSKTLAFKRLLTDVPGAGLAVHENRVFVNDFRTNRVKVLNYDDGTELQEVGPFDKPSGLCVVEDRLLAVAERGLDRVVLLDLHTLEPRGFLPGEKSGGETLSHPNDIACDSAGSLLVMDTGNKRIAVFQEDGTFVASVMQGFFSDLGISFSFLACNAETGQIAVSNNDEHTFAVLAPLDPRQEG